MPITSAIYTASGSILATIDGVEMTVPDDMGNRHRRILAEWEAGGGIIAPYVAPPDIGAVLVPALYAVAELTIADGVIDGIPLNSRLSAALWFDVGLYYVFFAETQPDTNYLAKAYDGPNTDLRISEKSADYFVVQAWDANGDPTDPAAVSIEIIRVG